MRAWPDQVVARPVVVRVPRREVVRGEPGLLHLLPQVGDDLVEHGLLVDADQARRGVVGEEADQDGDGRRDGRERHGERGPQGPGARPPVQERAQAATRHPQSSRST